MPPHGLSHSHGFASDGVNVEYMGATLVGVGMGLSLNTKLISAWILLDKVFLYLEEVILMASSSHVCSQCDGSCSWCEGFALPVILML